MTSTVPPRRVPWVANGYVVGIAALAAIPALVALLRFGFTTPFLDGDSSIFALDVADTAGGSFPLTGFYSRYGWSHPGPVAFYAFTPFHWLSGGAVWGLALGAFGWSVATMGITVWIASRRATTVHGTTVIAAAAATAQVLTWLTFPAASVIDPWTPTLATSLIVPLLFAAWGLAEGDAVAAGVAMVLGVVAAQIHVGFVVLCAGPLLAAAIAGWPHRRAISRRPVAIGAVISLAMMVPLVVDLVIGETGNAASLLRFFRRDAERVGWSRSLRIIAAEFSPRPTWLGGPHLEGLLGAGTEASVAWLLLPVVALGSAFTVARRRGDRAATRLLIVAGAALLTSIVAAAQIQGFVYDYLVRWRAPIDVVVVFAVAYAWAPVAAARIRRPGLRFAAPACLGVAVLAATGSVAATPHMTLRAWAWGGLMDEALDQVPDGPVLLRPADAGYQGVMSIAVWALHHDGVEVGVDPALTYIYGDRALAADEAEEVWYVTDGGWAFSALSGRPGARIVALETPYSPGEEAEVVALQREIEAGLRAAGRPDLLQFLDTGLVELIVAEVPGISTESAARLGALNAVIREYPRAGIVAFAPADAPDFYQAMPEGL